MVTLARAMVTGLAGTASDPSVFPAPPVSEFTAARNAAMTAEAVAQQATTDKDAALTAPVESMKRDLRYAENTVNNDNEKLMLAGWGA